MKRYLMAIFFCLTLSLGACQSGDVVVNATYDRLSGLLQDDPVVLQGGQVGEVSTIQYDRQGRYAVQLLLKKNFANAFTEHARFFIVDDPDRAGRKAVEIRHVQTGGRLLASGDTVEGSHELSGLGRQLQRDIEQGVDAFKQRLEAIGRDIQGFGESKAYHDLKQTMEGLARELSRKEAEAREKLKQEWLPGIQRELDGLREKLRELGREREMAPLDVQFEELRRI